jgi:hypothetical protein
VGAVAGAEPSAVVTSLADGHATQVCADACVWSVSHSPLPFSGFVVPVNRHTQHDEPLGLLNALVVGLGVS